VVEVLESSNNVSHDRGFVVDHVTNGLEVRSRAQDLDTGRVKPSRMLPVLLRYVLTGGGGQLLNDN
jgi:hypothetical protein